MQSLIINFLNQNKQVGGIMVAILSFVSLMMREVMGDDEFWDVLQCGEAAHRGVVYSKDSDFGYFTVYLEYPDIVTFKDWFGIGVIADDASRKDARKQLFKKLALGDYRSEEDTISVLLTDTVYGEILIEFSVHPDDDEAFIVHFTS
ncbi:MAG: hypothetical protein WDA75_19135 [Candidatus Latescibacterota bacterium]